MLPEDKKTSAMIPNRAVTKKVMVRLDKTATRPARRGPTANPMPNVVSKDPMAAPILSGEKWREIRLIEIGKMAPKAPPIMITPAKNP